MRHRIFLLGCVLDFKHQINYAGLYYAARPTDMTKFDEYNIVFIDPNDNVGLAIDGVQNTLIAVRQFVTDLVPPRLRDRPKNCVRDRPKNCENPQIEAIGDVKATAHERFRNVGAKQMEYCTGVSCRVVSYTTLLGTHTFPLVYAHHDVFLIDANGTLMIKDNILEDACSAKRGNSANLYNIIYEMCPRKLTS